MAGELAINALKEAAVNAAKEGLRKGVEVLKEGKNISEALKGGFEATKEAAFKELDNLLSPELEKSKEKLDGIQDKIESDTEAVKENPAEAVKGVNDVTENINDVAKDLEIGNRDPSFLSEIKESLQEFKEVLKEIQEVQNKLMELGVSSDMLSMLNAEAMEIDEMDDLEGEGEGTE